MLSVSFGFLQIAVFPTVRSVCLVRNGHMLCRIVSVCCMHTRTVHTSSVLKKEEPFQNKLLRFVGWLGGFYARKQVTVILLMCNLHVLSPPQHYHLQFQQYHPSSTALLSSSLSTTTTIIKISTITSTSQL